VFDDFDAMIAKLREIINESADDLYRRIVAETRESWVRFLAMKDRLESKGTTNA
jgi:hypothetical protein